MRWAALNIVVKAFKTSVPVSFLAPVLGFITPSSSPSAAPSSAAAPPSAVPLPGTRMVTYAGKAAPEASEAAATKACAEWLKSYGAVLEKDASGTRGGGRSEPVALPGRRASLIALPGGSAVLIGL